jgi:hypothetical protein
MMSKKPPLTLIGSASTGTQPPRPLGEHGLGLWRGVHAEYSIDDIGGIEMLAQACASLDRAEALAARIVHDGEVIYLKGVPRAHPAVKDELACRAFVVRTLQKLGLNVEQVKNVGRPSGGIGVTWDKIRDRE